METLKAKVKEIGAMKHTKPYRARALLLSCTFCVLYEIFDVYHQVWIRLAV